MKFVDANIIAYASYSNDYQDACQTFLRQDNLLTNTIVLVEAFNIIESEVNRETAVAALRSILRSNIEILSLDLTILFESLKKADKSNKLKFIDLVHYTTAKIKNCEVILSYDTDFDNLDIPREN